MDNEILIPATPASRFLGIACLVFFVLFIGAMIIVPIVEHKKAMKELEKKDKEEK